MHEYSYDDVYLIIARYCPAMRPYYADGQCRWPVSYAARTILAELDHKATWWYQRGEYTAHRLLIAARDTIRSHWKGGQ